MVAEIKYPQNTRCEEMLTTMIFKSRLKSIEGVDCVVSLSVRR